MAPAKEDDIPSASHAAVSPGRGSSQHSDDNNDNNNDNGKQDPDLDEDTRRRLEASARLENPLAGLSARELAARGEAWCRDLCGITDPEDVRAFRLGAQIAGGRLSWRDHEDEYGNDPRSSGSGGRRIRGGGGGNGREEGEEVDGEVDGEKHQDKLTERERSVLEREVTHKWHNPRMLYGVIVICSLCAAVQGMDETVVNGAQSFYKRQFGIGGESARDTWLLGLVNAAPYICSAFFGCWCTEPMNKVFGRRGTVFVSCLISALACIWQAFTNTWWHMFIARFALGFGIGPKSATTPILGAECSPPKLRGALVMQWQMWTAFGIMVGYVADLAFYKVPDRSGIDGLNWRLMMGSAAIPAVIVCAIVYFVPESPRWYLTKRRYADAYAAVRRLRYERVQAARDLFYMHTLLEVEEQTLGQLGHSKLREIFKVRRNRNAALASEIVMFMQQFCGVNAIAYYSTEIFLASTGSEISALAASLGFGAVNWLFAIPGMITIDTFGRRNLLLTTFPLMSIFLFFTGFSFWIPAGSTAQFACVALGIYLFGVVYSPGEGPVPFTYSAEAYPLYVRATGMSLATATTWFFNSIVSITWPSLVAAWTEQGAFAWYASWNVVGFFLVLFFLPETKEKTLEELDAVFDVPVRSLVGYGAEQAVWFAKRWVLCLSRERAGDRPRPPVSGKNVEAFAGRRRSEVGADGEKEGETGVEHRV